MISIVTGYYNRKKLFYHTLLQLKSSAIKDIEVIAVDDGSSEENRLEDLQSEFDFLKIVRIEPADKWYINACVPFNRGFKAARGEIIIIQNPECIHYGDILQYVTDHLQPNDYLNFAAYSLDKDTTDRINAGNAAHLETLQIPFIPASIQLDGEAGWYNHSQYRPKGFHWCSAIYKEALLDLGGFDEQFALGVAYDDIELLVRIKKKGMHVKFIDEPFVLHQNHFEIHPESNKSIHPIYIRKDADFLWKKNEYLFNEHTLKSKTWRVKKRSRVAIKLADLFLTTKLKWVKSYQAQLWRFKNKWSRTFG